MERPHDRFNELIVAIAVIGTIAVALTFGIILALSTNTNKISPDAQEAETVAAGLRTRTTPDKTEAYRTAHPGLSPTFLPTRPLSTTAVSDSTVTPTGVEPDSTPTGQLGPESPVPTTEVGVVISYTPRPDSTKPPTPTPTPTVTPKPPDTMTPTPSDTPSHTPTPTPTEVVATLTFTPYPSLTPSVTPFGGELTSTPAGSGCVVPTDWIKYTIQPGDTLYRLASRFRLSMNDLANANCLIDPGNITSGQILFVPPGSNITPVASPAGATDSAPVESLSFNCENPEATISQPAPGTVLSGAFAIYGTATHASFQFYRLQISGNGTNPSDFATINVYTQPVVNGELGTINTAAFTPGDYWLRLTLVDQTGNYPPECTIRVRFQ